MVHSQIPGHFPAKFSLKFINAWAIEYFLTKIWSGLRSIETFKINRYKILDSGMAIRLRAISEAVGYCEYNFFGRIVVLRSVLNYNNQICAY